MVRYQGSDKGPAFGAARLATTGEALEVVCTAPSILETIGPGPDLADFY
jgi:xylulokinase